MREGSEFAGMAVITVAVVGERHRLGLLSQRPPSVADRVSFSWHRSLWTPSSLSTVVTAATLFLMLVNGRRRRRRLGFAHRPTDRSIDGSVFLPLLFLLIACTVDTNPTVAREREREREGGGANHLFFLPCCFILLSVEINLAFPSFLPRPAKRRSNWFVVLQFGRSPFVMS